MAGKIAETPLMKQYIEMKGKHHDAILLFRVGDFYETFSDDAITASEILGITLTRRANGAAQFVELADISKKKKEELYLDELVLRFLSLKEDYNSMRDNLSEHMTSFMENETKYHNLFYDYEKDNFINIISLLYKVGPDVFKATNKQFSSALYDGIMVATNKFYEKYKDNVTALKEKIELLKNDDDYKYNMGSNSGGKGRVQKRISIAIDIFDKG